MMHDLVFAARLFRRQPGLFGATIAGLAVAIGISTAVFSLVHAILYADYGIAAPESVVRVAFTGGGRAPITGNSGTWGNWAYSDYLHLREVSAALEVVAAATTSADYRASAQEGAPLPIRGVAVSGSYFPVLGLRASRGRTLTPADDAPGHPLVVVSHGFWKNRLGGDASVVGRTVWLSERPFTVVGVADRTASVPVGIPPAFWITLASEAELAAARSGAHAAEAGARLQALRARTAMGDAERVRLKALEANLDAQAPRWNPAVDVFGRTKAGVTRPQAEAEVNAIATTLPGVRGTPAPGTRPAVTLAALSESEQSTAVLTSIMMTTVGLVVFLACANVTNLLLASAATRRREIGIRLAIGASRGRILQLLLTESLLLGAIGGGFGLLIAGWILSMFAAGVQGALAVDVSPDLTVYAFVGLLTVSVGLIAGMAPARYGARGDVVSALTSDQLGAPRPLPSAALRCC